MAIIIAKISLASVNSNPKTGTISRNMEGSMSGDAKQNAITGASGTPAISSPAMIGTTPQEQKEIGRQKGCHNNRFERVAREYHADLLI